MTRTIGCSCAFPFFSIIFIQQERLLWFYFERFGTLEACAWHTEAGWALDAWISSVSESFAS
ncbi:uncharacterized protein FFB20_04910 [Fusarium fujikuroi]|nr:uncharacterized protein FFB20_04910 [Fusarium fujikuroi]SCN76490.1 uncharacterized protein FFE2_03527 [Fusarium fujikuroi]SCN94722.1 uncharacterized protein FFC1_07106 [Fusarium fujikuroi]SCO48441.1 uncharacterized protein FFNC_12131 [Fusarium fujikuroi]SCV31052.1 uncharacterized protein FFFS_02718 [Fusarium fujikuroi]